MYKHHSGKKSRKTNNATGFNIKKLIRNALLIVAISEIVVLPIIGFTLTKFFVILFLSLLPIAATIFLTSLYAESKHKEYGKLRRTREDDTYVQETELFIPKKTDRSRERSLVVLDKKNFNWSIENLDRDNGQMDEEVRSSQTLTKNTEEDEEIKKRYNPYRSPFEPINPVTNPNETTEIENAQAIDPSESTTEGEGGDLFDEVCVNDSNFADSCSQIAVASVAPPLTEEYIEENALKNSELYQYDKNHNDEDNFNDSLFDCTENYTPCNKAVAHVESYEDEEDHKNNVSVFNKDSKVVKLVFKPRKEDIHTGKKTTLAATGSVKYPEQEDDLPYAPPTIQLLKSNNNTDESSVHDPDIEYKANKLVDTLASFGVGAKVLDVSKGPSVTRYELQPNAGVKVSKIVGLSDDIALNLAATGVRIEAPIPGKAAVGIEVPNKEVTPVLLRDVIESEEFQNHPSKLAFAVGKDVAGRTIVGDIAKMPHMLIAGATGSGKSVCINTLITSILYKSSPKEVKLLMVDPKVVELGIYNGIPHLLIPVVTDPKKAAGALNWAVIEMTTRYKLFAENNVRDLKGYNALMKELGEEILPQVVIIIDELADLMMVAANDVEDCICRLAQMARAAGMHLVIATQRPSVDVITGVIKANIPSRISFAVSSQIDSRTILDMAGAEKLLGRGDMLYSPIGEPKPIRVQGGFISDKEVEAVVNELKANFQCDYDQDIVDRINTQAEQQQQHDSNDEDELLSQVIEMVLDHGQASASLIQRKFKVGYSRAARILDQMESWGVVGPSEGSKPRQLLITKQEWDELNS